MHEIAPSATGRFSPRRVFWTFLVGSLLVQVAWILTLPTFRGIDEFDHVYKAEAVASGQWLSRAQAPNGRGALVEVNESTIRAASEVCDWYDYTLPGNCHPIEELGGGRATVATAAGGYNPAYYLVVGTAAKPFEGDAANQVMRLTTALMCSLLLAWGAALTARWARTTWPLLAYLTASTPMLLYSTSIVAPNGLTYSGALLVWMAILSLDQAPHAPTSAAAGLVAGAVAMLPTHTTGPLWLALIGLTALLFRPLRQWLALVRANPRTFSMVAALVATAGTASLLWTRQSRANTLGEPDPVYADGYSAGDLVTQQMLWVLQSIAAFPTRAERAPVLVYAVWIAIFVGVLLLILWRGVRRERLMLVVLLVLFFLVPSLLTHLAFPSEGFAWQGRYSLPIAFGFTALAVRAAGRRERADRGPWATTFFALTAVAMAVSTVSVGMREATDGPTSPVAASIPLGFVVVALLSVVGVLLPWLAFRPSPKGLVPVTHTATSVP